MVNWNLLHKAISPDSKPTPGWLFHEICQDVRTCPGDCPDVAEYLMQCVCNDQINIQLKAVLTIKHLASDDVTFQQYMQSCPGALKVLEDIAAPPAVPQARSLEPQEVKIVRDATKAALGSIHTPHTVEKSTEAAQIKDRIQGFGNFEPPAEEQPSGAQGLSGQVAEFVGDAVGDMVDDFREKGALVTVKDATIDALDLVLDGVDAVWGWLAGGRAEDRVPRICQPTQVPVGPELRQLPAVPQPPPAAPNPYAAAFGLGVIGAHNPVVLGGPSAGAVTAAAGSSPNAGVPAAASTTDKSLHEGKPQDSAPMVDLLSMDQPKGTRQAPAPAASLDLLGDMDS